MPDEYGQEPAFPHKGAAVRIRSGPFAGREGTVTATNKSRRRVRVLTTIYGRAILCDLAWAALEPPLA
jgi:transcription antitermination factor NusG